MPSFSTPAELFSTAGLSGGLFAATDGYRLFAQQVYPALARIRDQLETCSGVDHGRIALEPVLLLGVSLLQYLEAGPDRQAVDLLHDHAGWNFALNRQVGEELFPPTTLVNFRQRLLDHELSPLGFELVLEALVGAGWVGRHSRPRLDSAQLCGRVSRMSRLDCFFAEQASKRPFLMFWRQDPPGSGTSEHALRDVLPAAFQVTAGCANDWPRTVISTKLSCAGLKRNSPLTTPPWPSISPGANGSPAPSLAPWTQRQNPVRRFDRLKR